MHLAITERKLGDVIILDLAGRLWILDLPLRDRMNDLLALGHRHFVLNLGAVDYIDSSGLELPRWLSLLARRRSGRNSGRSALAR